MSVCAMEVEKYKKDLDLMKEYTMDILEINVTCRNTG